MFSQKDLKVGAFSFIFYLVAILVTHSNSKGENHTMVKFVDIPYVRPDMDKVLDSVKAAIQSLKTAKTYEEFRSAYMDYSQIGTDLVTLQQLVYMRHTVDMLDEFYTAENAFFNKQMPRYSIATKELRTVILNSPFKKEFICMLAKQRRFRYNLSLLPFYLV